MMNYRNPKKYWEAVLRKATRRLKGWTVERAKVAAYATFPEHSVGRTLYDNADDMMAACEAEIVQAKAALKALKETK